MKSLLQIAGLRSSCCNAKIVVWHANKYYCAKCESWLYKSGKPEPIVAHKASGHKKAKLPKTIVRVATPRTRIAH